MLALFLALSSCSPPDPLESLDERYTTVMVDMNVAERDTTRNIHNKEARRRKVQAENARVEFFKDALVVSAIDKARQSEDAATRVKGEAYHRARLQSLGWSEDEKVQEERLIRELEEARGEDAFWTAPEGGKDISLSRSSWFETSREADALSPEDRAQLAQEYADHQMGIAQGQLQSLVRLRNEVARRAGYDNYWALALEAQGLKAEQVDQLITELTALVTPIQTEVAARVEAAAKELGIANDWANRPLLRRHAGLEAGRDEIDPFADVDRAEEAVMTALQDMGISTEGWQVYTGPSRTVRSGVYGFPVRPPKYVAIVMSTDARWSIRHWELMAHEAGHLVWWTNTTEDVAASPALWEPAPPWAEGFAGFFESLASQPSFLERYMPDVPEDKRAAFADYTAWADAEDIAREIIAAVAERRLYEDPNSLEAITRAAAELEKQLFLTPDMSPKTSSGTYYTSSFISNVTWNYPGYRPNFLFAAVTEAELADAVMAAVGGDPVGNPKVGPFLVDKMIRGPADQTVEDRLKALVPGNATDALAKRLKPPPPRKVTEPPVATADTK